MLPELLDQLFDRYAPILCRYRKCFILVPFLMCVLLSTGWFRFTMENNLQYLFMPSSSLIKHDTLNVARFFALDSADTKYVLWFAKNEDRNVLSPLVARDIRRSIQQIETEIVVQQDGKQYRFLTDMARQNVPTYRFNRLISGLMEEYAGNNSLEMRYPMTELLRQRIYLPFAFGGLLTDPTTNLIISSPTLVLYLVVDESNRTMQKVSAKFEQALWTLALNHSVHPLTDMSIHTWDSMLDEVRKNTLHTLRFVPGAFVLTLSFAVLVSCRFPLSLSLHWHAVVGLLSVGMSFMASMGFMFHLGFAYNDMVSVTTFIALAIGVDDTFVMLAAWRQHLDIIEPEQRLRAMLKDAGAGITFTSLTDVVAFGIGIGMDVPALRSFCAFTAVALLCDYLIQITFFPAALLFCDSAQMELNFPLVMLAKTTLLNGFLSRTLLTENESENGPTIGSISNLCFAVVSRPGGQIILIIGTLITTLLTIFGIARLHADSSLTKVMVDDSRFYKYAIEFERLYWGQGTLFTFVTNAPDFASLKSISDFNRFIFELESVQNAVGPKSTQLWVRDFLDYAQTWKFRQEEMNREVMNFLQGRSDVTNHMQYRNVFDHFQNKTVTVPARFHFFTAYEGSQNWLVRRSIVQGITDVKLAYTNLDVMFYHEMIECVDLMGYTMRSLGQTLGIVLTVTFMITALFLPIIAHYRSLLLVITSFMSINASVVGLLSFWGVDIDLVMMICLLMSVGFSVDYTVHMAFVYAKQKLVSGLDAKERVRKSLDHLAIPILQSGLSTLIAVSLITFVHSYMLRTFVKTIFLVVLFGLAQSLLVLPACFIIFDNHDGTQFRRKFS